MPLLSELNSSGKKRLTIHEAVVAFRKAFPEHAQAPDIRSRLLAALRELEEKGSLELPKRGWDHSGRPGLPNTILLKSSIVAVKPERKEAWVPELSFAPMVANPARLEILRKINAFLIRRRGTPIIMIPVEERSLEIFGDEKRLGSLIQQDGRLFEGRLLLQTLGAYRVKPPLVHTISKAAPTGSPILIIENLATFESFRNWNLNAGVYSALVLGNGNSLSQAHVSLDDLGAELGTSSFFYFGDLDPAGIEIFWRINRARTEAGLPLLKPHLALYFWLLEHGVRKSGETKVLPKHQHIVEEIFISGFASRILELWASGNVLPQEGYGTEKLMAKPEVALPPLHSTGL